MRVDSMRKVPLALGVMLLFVGAVVFSESNRAVKLTPTVKTVAERLELPVGEWEISAYFNESERLLVDFPPPSQEEIIPNGDMIFEVCVVDPEGGNTSFRVAFSTRGDVNVNLTGNDGGLVVSEPVTEAIGTTQHRGSYTAKVHTDEYLAAYYYPPSGNLTWLHLNKVVERVNYPSIGYLPVGVGLIIGGAVLSGWGARSSRRS